VAVNGSGQNLTDSPDGAGNLQVGTYEYDFSGLYPDGTGALPNLINIDNEYSFVIADSRGLMDTNLDDDNDVLGDETNPETDDGAFIDDATQFARIDHVVARLDFIRPSYLEAWVWNTDVDTGEVDDDVSSLGQWLDDQQVAGAEGDPDNDVWNRFRACLRFPLHWAFLIIDCQESTDQGLADYIAENTALNEPNNPKPFGGPNGIQLAYEGDTSDALRLWMPKDGRGPCRVLAQGHLTMGFELRLDSTDARPDVPVDIDLGEAPADQDAGYLIPATDNVVGRNIHLKLTLDKRITMRDDQLLVLCVQTGRVRLKRGDAAGTPDQLIAGPPLVGGRNGPLMPIYHFQVSATGVTR